MDIDKKYVIDIDNIIRFCFEDDEKQSDSEITEVYVSDDENQSLKLASKQLREVKSGDASSKQTLKYDLIKTFIGDLISVDDTDLSLGDTILINTMLNEGFLKEIN